MLITDSAFHCIGCGRKRDESQALGNVFLEGAVVDWIRKILPSMWVRAFARRKEINFF